MPDAGSPVGGLGQSAAIPQDCSAVGLRKLSRQPLAVAAGENSASSAPLRGTFPHLHPLSPGFMALRMTSVSK